MKNIAFIPVRSGSTRLKKKALSYIQEDTLLSIAIKKSIKANCFDEVICMGDSDEFRKISFENDIKYIERDPLTASNDASADQVVNEIIQKTSSDNIFWVNITHPFTKIETLDKAVKKLSCESDIIDSLFTVHNWHGHASFASNFEKPLNFNADESFSQTQSLDKIFLLTYGIMAWKSLNFLDRYKFSSGAMTNGKIGTLEVSRLESIWIKYQSDLEMVNEIVNKRNIWDFICR